MNAKTTIRKILFITAWLCIGAGMLTLLIAAISNKKKGQCKDFIITLKGPKNNFFINEQDVEQLLLKANQGSIRGRAVDAFNLHELEQALEKNTWISKAELYFDNNDRLHITVTEKEPVARVFTTTDHSFYLDSAGKQMPLSDKRTAKVPVFTGFPGKQQLNAKDSMLLKEIKKIALFISEDPFWMSQVAQVDINKERKFEMVPVVGSHVVRLGSGDEIAAKFNRLMVFYKQILSKTGFDHYKLIDVQYKGQVVASRYAGDAKVDSVQLKKNVDRLLKYSTDAAMDTVIRVAPVIRLEKDSIGSAPGQGSLPSEVKKGTDKNEHSSNEKKRAEKKKSEPKAVKPVPKAVMPKKEPVEDENGGY